MIIIYQMHQSALGFRGYCTICTLVHKKDAYASQVVSNCIAEIAKSHI